MHSLGGVVVESDHRLHRGARRRALRPRHVAPDRGDVLQHPALVAFFLVDPFVELIADFAQALVAARRGGSHDRAEVPDDVVEIAQERPVFGKREALVHHRMHPGQRLDGAPACV